MKISYSRYSTYLRCRQAHYFGYVECLRQKKASRPLTFGGDFHKLLQHRNDKPQLKIAIRNIKETFNGLSGNNISLIGDNYVDELKTVFKDYQYVWKNEEQPQHTEHEFLIRIGKIGSEPVYFHGLMDEVYEGGILGEHKTFTSKPNALTLAMNPQVTIMSKAWYLETGEILKRVRWDYIHSKPSDQPIWLEKSSRFSDAASQKITPMSWLRACKERGIAEEEILAKALKYESNIPNFFFKKEFDMIQEMVDFTWDSFKEVSRDIVLRGGSSKVKNVTRDCSWCNFKDLCFAEFTGADVNYIKKKDFVVSERDDWSTDMEVESE